ncbi:hypothetical protein J0J23_22660, partial [Vibrio vulnificus]|uniref:hypothetical protein n=1 Tax=Vibrio vulnificus TaxID=672 RepID=UPI0019D43CA2
QLVDDFDQIANDSDVEGSDRTEVLDDDELRSGECDSMTREKSSCSPVLQNDEELIVQNTKMIKKPQISGRLMHVIFFFVFLF